MNTVESTSTIGVLVRTLVLAGQQAAPATATFRLWKPTWRLTSSGRKDLRDRVKTDLDHLRECCVCISDAEWRNRPVSDLGLIDVNSQSGSRQAKTRALIFERFEVQEDDEDTASETEGEDEEDPEFKKALRLGKSGTPSKNAQPRQYREYQAGPAPILDGRYALSPNPVTMPVELFHSAFATFLAIAGDDTRQPSEDVIDGTVKLMKTASQIGTSEALRQPESSQILTQLLDYPVMQSLNQNRTVADHVIVHSRLVDPKGSALLCVCEEKLEIGSSGDATVQGSFSYIQHWAQENLKALASACCAPSFIIALSGPWVIVLGAIFTTRAIVQRLTDYIWMGHARELDDAHAFRLMRVFTGLRAGIASLREFYEAPELKPTNRFCPLATECTEEKDGTNTKLSFRYIRPLKVGDPSNVAFLAVDNQDSSRRLVVKFAERYGEDAHRSLAAAGLAPRLLYCGPIWPDSPARDGCGSRKMVVIEYIKGKSAHELYGSCALPGAVRQAARTAVEHLHRAGFVFGDLRPPNLMIEDGEEDEDLERRTKLIDFDWAGRAGAVRYPLHLSQGIRWAPGVADYALITREHDLYMLDQLSVLRNDVII
ncbi:uncharacterized protein TRAVEDRAFT_37662 [Trametes versicolor FP-101664 SS1]|uniref:uncharacterized protein n=1 Tax=Trametes versicolor (strain FP-101664) TaxID=717944 RepID=UPI00046249AB|nr:uncharacterized protein TRAVEDRAFT_37662 [Trametes versicolor FP-101664 SS1]EIW58870.1 hypothetical protein TRAVEDRAFT_37662 [Trametes versicolor FP-101664 SS1]